jgi:methylated-DNA-[protein]-cysteine S-methyltransferase
MSQPITEAGNGLAAQSAEPGVDPCDVACEAMPARVLGDLAPEDVDWLGRHLADCSSCARELAAYERLDDLVDVALGHERLTPPPVRLPGHRPVAWLTRVDSTIGPLLMAASEDGLCELTFEGFRHEDEVRELLASRGYESRAVGTGMPAAVAVTLERAVEQLAQYFGGVRQQFDLPLDFRGMTPFTRSVLEATANVPFGRLETYRGIAGRIGKPGASRAVGNALGRNPLPVVVPCHRVVATGGGIGGYTGGLAIKERLLAIEGACLR